MARIGGDTVPTARTRANRKWNEKAYAQLGITIPKARKPEIAALAAANGETVNGLVNRLLWEYAGMTEEQWRATSSNSED